MILLVTAIFTINTFTVSNIVTLFFDFLLTLQEIAYVIGYCHTVNGYFVNTLASM